jgi:holo-[acyl-carrier protein] synthase
LQLRKFTSKWNIGVDIVDVDRFRRLDYFHSKKFYERIFTQREIKYCLSFEDPAPHFAANFAAKEAVCKALNGFYNIKLNEVEVLRDEGGAPYVTLRIGRKEIAKHSDTNKKLSTCIRISLSHSTLHAIAFAVVALE